MPRTAKTRRTRSEDSSNSPNFPSHSKFSMEEQENPQYRQLITLGDGAFDVSNPLRGVVLCCTAIPAEKRVELASQIEQMGAHHKYDLTSEVTHLIVGDNTTDKYKYVARERPDIKVITLDWVSAVRELWIQDLAIDVDQLEKDHKYPTFASLKICMTGFEDQIERQSIIDDVTENGAEYHGDLTKNVTHLIAYKSEGPKYRHAKSWGLKVIAVEWLRDSLERGMILDEELYGPEDPKEERGKGAWVRQRVAKSPLGKRSRGNCAAGLDYAKRKLRRTASTKLTSQNQNIWGDIVGSNSKVQVARSGQWEEPRKQSPELEVTTAPQKRGSIDTLDVSSPAIPTKRGILGGCRFYIHGFQQMRVDILQKFLLSHGAEISNTIEELVSTRLDRTYIVVPHDTPASDAPNIPQCDGPIGVVTEWWIERCLETKAFFDPQDYTLGLPFPTFPIPKFDSLVICLTGFEGLQLLHISKATMLIGAKFEEWLSKDVSVLICNPNRMIRRDKLVLSQELKIPVVPLAWLLDSIKTGEMRPLLPYIQRVNEAKVEICPAIVVDTDLADGGRRCSTEDKNEFARIEPQGSKDDSRPAIAFEIDKTAFEHDLTPTITEEFSPVMDSTPAVEPLKEISPNSPHKTTLPPSKEATTVVRVIGSAVTLPPKPQETISDALTSFLAKSKTTVAQAHDRSEQANGQEGVRKKRAPSRILGRAASNVSAVSAISRASSVDSTSSSGQVVTRPTLKGLSGEQQQNSSSLPGSNILVLMNGLTGDGTNNSRDDESQPSMTQVQYDDPESTEYKEQVIARVTGSTIEKKVKERAPSIASLDNLAKGNGASRGRKMRTLRERINGKGRV